MPKAQKPKAGPDPAQAIAEQVQTEAERLRLRQIRQVHRDLDAEERDRKLQVKGEKQREKEAVQQKELAKARAAREAEAARQREAAEREAKGKRREILGDVKRQVVGGWWRSGYEIGSEAKAQALEEIERRLWTLPLEELGRAEAVEIAKGIRDSIYEPIMRTQDEAKKREAAAREEQERQREAERRAKAAAIERGRRYAEDALQDIAGLDSWKRAFWLVAVGRDLDRTLTGGEAPEAVEAAVDAILKPKLRDLERERREAEDREGRRKREEEDSKRGARKRQLFRHGQEFARGEVEEDEDVGPGERWEILSRVERGLRDKLTGEESEEEVEDLVQDLLEEELE